MQRPIPVCLRLLPIAALVGCASMLPKTKTESPTFQNFDDARKAVESLVPMQSDVSTLSGLGIEPIKQPNTLILTYSDVIKRVANGSVIGKEDLDAGVVRCIEARDACRGWDVNVMRITKERTGGFWADFFNFTRRTETSGWRFNALILLVNDVVVYRSWVGQPVVHDLEVHNNPLGPLQDAGPAMVPPPPSIAR